MKSPHRALRVIAAVTAVIGFFAAMVIGASLPVDQRSFATVAASVERLISFGVPFFGAVATSSLHVQPNPNVRGAILHALSWAVGFAIFGVVAATVVVGTLPSKAPGGRWEKTHLTVLGSVLVQVVAQRIGCGFGLLVRRPVVASLCTIVFPLGLWLVLGTFAPQARPWLTPMEGANQLLAGTMSSGTWLPYVVMLGLWVVGLNLAGLRRLDESSNRRQAAHPRTPA